MNLTTFFVLLFCALTFGQSPSPSTPTQAQDQIAAAGGFPAVSSTKIPFNPSALPPGYQNPYYPGYNPAAGPAVPILSYTNDHGADGTYSYSFTTADGKQVQESGYLKDAYIDNAGEPQGTQVVQGSYAYVAPDGTPIQVSYIADENGFRPSGVHIPADGKGLPPPPVSPVPLVDGKIDPAYNRYNPFYNNNFNRPYDPRYPYDPRHPYDTRFPHNSRYPHDPRYPYNSRYPYDPSKYNPFFNNFNNALNNKDGKEEPKKDSA